MNAVIIVAGGSGRRMGGTIPKQFLELNGKPMILHTLDRFYNYDPGMEVVLVLAESHRKIWDSISLTYNHGPGIVVAKGGETRYDSVKSGLKHIGDGMVVGVHDAVRPLVSRETIQRCYEAAALTGSGIPVVEMDDSVRMLEEGGRSINLERGKLRRVQTPQVFRSELIRKAYGKKSEFSFTDDASVFETHYGEVTLVEGNRENIKITTPADLKLSSLIL